MTYSVPQDMSSQGVPEVAQERSFEEQVGGHLARLDAERTAPVEKPADDASVLTFPMLLDIYSGWVSRSAMALVDPKRGGLAVVVGASDNADNVRARILRRFEEQSGGAAAPDRLLGPLRAFLSYLSGPANPLGSDDRARARRLLDAMPLVALPAASDLGGAAALRADVVTSVVAEIEALRRDMRLILGATIREVLTPRLDLIESLVRGGQQ